MDFIIRPATPEDALSIAPRLRAADRQEIFACTGQEPIDVLPAGVTLGDRSWVAVQSGDVAALGGVVKSQVGAAGIPWLVATDSCSPRLLVHHIKPYIAKIRADYQLLTNFVDMRNSKHIQWLHKMGFEFGDINFHYGVARLPFIQFYMGSL